MKAPITYLFLLLGLPMITFGQIAKKNTIFDISANVIANDQNISDRIELNSLATPKVLYFFSDNFALGGQIIVGAVPDKGGIAGFRLDSRYYFGVIESQALFLTGDIGFNRFDVNTTWKGNIGLGLNYFLTRSIALESVFSFGFTKIKNPFFETPPNELRMNLGAEIKVFFDRSFDYYKDRTSVLKRGIFLIGGSFGGLEIVKVDQERNNGSTINLVANFGYFLTKRLLTGTQFVYFRNKASVGSTNTSQLKLTGFLRYYLTSNKNRGILFVEFGRGRVKRKEPFTTITGGIEVIALPTSTINYGSIGIDFFFTPRIAIESKLGYEWDKGNYFFQEQQGFLDVSLQFFLGK